MSEEQETQVVGDQSSIITAGQMQRFWQQVGDGSVTKNTFQAFLEHRNPFAITDIGAEWQEFYRKYFLLNIDFSGVVIPDDPGGFERVIFIPKGLIFAHVIKMLYEQFMVFPSVKDPATEVTRNVRTPEPSYAIRIRDRQEADDELKLLSAIQLKEQGINCITLLEHLVFTLKYWSETNEHLDLNISTLCPSFHCSGGDVSCVGWDLEDCGLRINWYESGRASELLRARQAVSLT